MCQLIADSIQTKSEMSMETGQKNRRKKPLVKKTMPTTTQAAESRPSTEMFSDEIHVQIGDTIQCSKTDAYIIDEYLSKGRYGKVYKVIQKNRPNAKPRACKIQTFKVDKESSIHRLLIHKHIVKLFCSYCSPNYCFMFMEYCKNGTLRDLVRQRGDLTVYESRYFFYQINLGVRYMHKMKIIHRDLKLDNIFLADNMQIKIGDFGLAKHMNETQKKNVRVEQNRSHYKAPELFKGKDYSAASDIWAIGVILYKMVFNQSPFQVDDTFIAAKKFKFHFNIENNDDLYEMLREIFQPIQSRPNANQCLNLDFLCVNKIPKTLPDSIHVEPTYEITDSDSLYEP